VSRIEQLQTHAFVRGWLEVLRPITPDIASVVHERPQTSNFLRDKSLHSGYSVDKSNDGQNVVRPIAKLSELPAATNVQWSFDVTTEVPTSLGSNTASRGGTSTLSARRI
jgi:malate synthase